MSNIECEDTFSEDNCCCGKTPEMYGAFAGGGVDPDVNAEKLAEAFQDSVYTGIPICFSAGKIYRTSKLDIPPESLATGCCRLRPVVAIVTGEDAADHADITIGDKSIFENLVLELPATTVNPKTCRVKTGVTIKGRCEIRAADRKGGGVSFEGNDISVGSCISMNVDTPFMHKTPDSEADPWTGLKIGHFDITDYLRGISIRRASDWTIGSGAMRGRVYNQEMAPGQNAIIVSGAQNGTFGDLNLADSGEHAIRIGGSGEHDEQGDDLVDFPETRNLSFGHIVVRKSRGCAFKSNDGSSDQFNNKRVTSGVTIASLAGYDIGGGDTGSNSELLRLSHIRDFKIGFASATAVDTAFSCQHLLKLVDVDGLYIGALEGSDLRSYGIVLVSDDWGGPTPDVRNVYIDMMKATFAQEDPDEDPDCNPLTENCFSPANSAIRFNLAAVAADPDYDENDPDGDPEKAGSPVGKVANFYIGDCDVAGVSTGLGSWAGETCCDGPVWIRGCVRNGKAGGISFVSNLDPDAELDARVMLDVEMLSADGLKRTSYRGKASFYGARTWQHDCGSFVSTGDPAGQNWGPTLQARDASSGLNAKGPSLTFERPGSSRRGCVLVAEQDHADINRIALGFWSATSPTTNNVSKQLTLHSDGSIEIHGNGVGLIARSASGAAYKLVPPDGGGSPLTARWVAVA